jgi:hypothetical protein
MSYLACNRILYEEWEDRQYKLHLKKVLFFLIKKNIIYKLLYKKS